ncbi:MAG: calcium/sodium antiporter, partial [Verrucomicrobiota bacterium]
MSPIFWDIVLLIVGFAILLGGADLLVRGASKIALMVGISPLVVGLTVVAFGTSSPEGAVSIFSAVSEQPGIAIGNIVGSNLMNILIVIGISAAITPFTVSLQIIKLEIPLMIAASGAFYLMALDGVINTLDGFILFSAIVFYTVWAIRKSRNEHGKMVETDYVEEYKEPGTQGSPRHFVRYGLMVILGIAGLVAAAQMLVKGGSDIARILGVSDLLIGLTIVALGTSLPELATSIVAGFKKKHDIAVGNIIGSNLFNLLAVIGVSGLLVPGGLEVSQQALTFDIPVMMIVSIACLPIFFTAHKVSRW